MSSNPEVKPVSLRRVLIANRGEIAVRIVRACQGLGIETVVAVSEADRDSLAARLADRAVCIGAAPSTDSYLRADKLIAAAIGTGCDGVHPGYGFLSESAVFAQQCLDAGLWFVGPSPAQIARMGDKLQARAAAEAAGIPMLEGSKQIASAEAAAAVADRIGYPVILKASAGGGGRGMKIVGSPDELAQAFASASGEARAAFGNDALYMERYLANARHVEVQVLGDAYGNLIHLGERDCSLQRRHQKVLEEAPASGLPAAMRAQLCEVAVRLAKSIGYRNAGTVEFIVDPQSQGFYFLEMNTRIQVEHPVSEMITGIDLVQEQLRIARGEPLSLRQEDVVFRGHAIECRLNAESPARGFHPSPGVITKWSAPQGPFIRLDTHCHAGYRVPPYYDSMLGKIVVYGPNRDAAIASLQRVLERFEVEGIETTLPFLQFVVGSQVFANDAHNTRSIASLLEEFSADLEAANHATC